MIIYGKRAKMRKIFHHDEMKCPSCQHAGMSAVHFQSYAHIYWIPLFPMSRVFALECPQCKAVVTEKEADALLMDTKSVRHQRPTIPLWSGVGMVLIAALFAFGVVMSKRDAAVLADTIRDPHIGDVVIVKTTTEGEDGYFAAQVLKLENDQILLRTGKHIYNRLKGARKETSFPHVDQLAEGDALIQMSIKDFQPVEVSLRR